MDTDVGVCGGAWKHGDSREDCLILGRWGWEGGSMGTDVWVSAGGWKGGGGRTDR